MKARLPNLLRYLHKFDRLLFFDFVMPADVPVLPLPQSIEVAHPELKKQTFFPCTPEQEQELQDASNLKKSKQKQADFVKS